MKLGLMLLPTNRRYDIVVYGHSHHFDVRKGRMLLVNPGQCKGCDSGDATAAILDLDSVSVKKLVLGNRERPAPRSDGKERT